MRDESTILGPFIGHTTTVSTKIWIYAENHRPLYVSIYKNGQKIKSAKFNFSGEIPAACVEIEGLQPNQKYNYLIFRDEENSQVLPLDSLNADDLHFYTMPEELTSGYRYDFIVMSCHNPSEAADKGYKTTSWNIWQKMPQILEETTRTVDGETQQRRVLFALLIGDQIYADEIERVVLQEDDERTRINHYLNIYTQFWDNQAYRKVLCSLPAYLMWDDHDITDGWGSREDAYVGTSTEMSQNWKNLFSSARKSFSLMQASRNPAPLTPDGFDIAFKIGRAGFVLADLRSNRNKHDKKLWLDSQFQAVKNWIEANRSELDILFFISTVVFAHGAPKIETGILKHWPPHIQDFFDRVWEKQAKFSPIRKTITNYALGIFLALFFAFSPPIFSIFLVILFFLLFYIRPGFLISHLFANLVPPVFVNYYYTSIGDLRDDINDSWYSDANKARSEEVLNYFFDIQNDDNQDTQLYVCILSGDIHTAGYSNIYSINPKHEKRPVINHIVASPVSYPPFSWLGEAFYRKYTQGAVPLGTSGQFQAQIAHHFAERNVLVCSLRDYGEKNLQLKAKFYTEKFPEPQTSVFDLEKNSHKENIKWE